MHVSENEEDETLSLSIVDVSDGELQPDGHRPIKVATTRGNVHLRLYEAPAPRAGIVWVGGVGGGFDSPADGLYPRLCRELTRKHISSCRVQFRNPRVLEEAVLDTMVALQVLTQTGATITGIVGHSFGGAVALQAATMARSVKTVVTLATQSAGATVAADLATAQSVLLVHGTADDMLPPACSRTVERLVPGRKRLVLFDANHNLDEAAEAVTDLVRRWLLAELGGDGVAHPV